MPLYPGTLFMCHAQMFYAMCVGKNADFMYMQASKNQILFLNFEKDK